MAFTTFPTACDLPAYAALGRLMRHATAAAVCGVVAGCSHEAPRVDLGFAHYYMERDHAMAQVLSLARRGQAAQAIASVRQRPQTPLTGVLQVWLESVASASIDVGARLTAIGLQDWGSAATLPADVEAIPEVWLFLGDVFAFARQQDHALRAWEQFATRVPGLAASVFADAVRSDASAVAGGFVGIARVNMLNTVRDGMNELEGACRAMPKSIWCKWLALACWRDGNPPRARAYFQRALSLATPETDMAEIQGYVDELDAELRKGK